LSIQRQVAINVKYSKYIISTLRKARRFLCAFKSKKKVEIKSTFFSKQTNLLHNRNLTDQNRPFSLAVAGSESQLKKQIKLN